MGTVSITHGFRLALIAAVLGGSLVAFGAHRADAAVGGVPCQRTFASSDPAAIADDGTVTRSTIDVPEDGLEVTDVDIRLDMHYPVPADLRIDVQNTPDDDSSIRANNVLYDQEQGISGPGSANMLGTVFDDQATVPISWGNAPYTGRFMPKRPFGDMVQQMRDLGDGVSGKYLLLVINFGQSGTGTLDDWSLTLRYAACDFDSDGVEDHSDKCLAKPGATASGCPVAARALTARYAKGAFRGALSSSVPGCRVGRPVQVYKVRSGPDRLVGTAASRSDGSYRLARVKRLGRYYATSTRVVLAGVAECPAVRSAIFRIR